MQIMCLINVLHRATLSGIKVSSRDIVSTLCLDTCKERKKQLLCLGWPRPILSLTTPATVGFSLPNTTPWPGSHTSLICQVFVGASGPFFLILFPWCPKNLDSVIGYFCYEIFPLWLFMHSPSHSKTEFQWLASKGYVL